MGEWERAAFSTDNENGCVTFTTEAQQTFHRDYVTIDSALIVAFDSKKRERQRHTHRERERAGSAAAGGAKK